MRQTTLNQNTPSQPTTMADEEFDVVVNEMITAAKEHRHIHKHDEEEWQRETSSVLDAIDAIR